MCIRDRVSTQSTWGKQKMSTVQKPREIVQTFGRKKNAVAVATCRTGRGLIRVNGVPIDIITPAPLRVKALEPVLLLGAKRFSKLDIRIRTRGGGYTAQIYAIRQALAKSIVAYYQKFVDENSKREVKQLLLSYDRSLLVADPRRPEPKKFGGRGARARRQKSYRQTLRVHVHFGSYLMDAQRSSFDVVFLLSLSLYA
eukprot:TRINITY_DN593_c0_g1_i10.p1 TRINITY_DN593_c0_g1~~TRINITY_DN593_c0_g1_i10.p1  ORF type:complete len:214 (-),score=75.49 TRINITY_DN593_c0_g1_i10:14-607(-)